VSFIVQHAKGCKIVLITSEGTIWYILCWISSASLTWYLHCEFISKQTLQYWEHKSLEWMKPRLKFV